MKDKANYKPKLLRTLYSDFIGVYEYYTYLPLNKEIKHYIVEFRNNDAVKQFKNEGKFNSIWGNEI
jgi:hypothetical protein